MDGTPEWKSLSMLLMATAQQVAGRMRPAFEASGLKPRQVELLQVLAQQRSTTQQQLLDILGVDPSILVGLLNDLEGKGLIQRVRDTRDRRRHIVVLSPDGLHRLDDILHTVETAETPIFDALSPADQRALRDALTRLGLPGTPTTACDAEQPQGR
ncbi:MarR family winged helix-turn-helix transcriptional regulator [Actinoplanes sp. NPDC051494]|uniref:MarR family winged helix-turn-helix transcriptional regulator n=1 Tax=Actinoplanes sp. NPDC051494 TaxID=3363907 RepID=UPI0037A64915